MDFSNDSVLPNQLPNSMSIPPGPIPQHQENGEKEKLQLFWQKQMFNIQVAEAFKSQQQLPLARIKRIMKSDWDMISGEAPLLMEKACEVFIQELTFRAWMRAEETNESIVLPSDVAKAIMQNEVFEFLKDVIPNDLLQYFANHGQEEIAGNFVEGYQAVLSHASGFMGNPMMNLGSEENDGNFVEGNQAAQPHAAAFMGNPMSDMVSDLVARNQQFLQPYMIQEKNGGNFVAENQATLPRAAGFMGNPMMNRGSQEENVGNFVEGNQAALPHAAGFMGNPMMNMGSQQQNAGNFVEGNQAALPYAAGFMGNPMMNMGSQEENAGNFVEGNQATLSLAAGFMGNPMMNMGSDLVAGNQQFPQLYMIQPPFMPSDQMPYNSHPK